MSKPAAWRSRYWQDWCQVTSANELSKQGKGRPIYLNTANWTDETYSWFSTLATEYMRRAYRNQVDVYHASEIGGTGFFDIFTDEWMYFGPNPKSDPVAGFDCARWEDDEYTPLRHARTDKLCNMRNPFASGEILQDQQRMIGFLCNKASCYQVGILDRDGKVAIPMPGAPYNMGILDLLFVNHSDYNSYIRQGGEMYFYSLLYEQILRSLIANHGRFSNGGTDGPGTFDQVLVQYPRNFLAKDDLFIVKSVDMAHGLIHAAWFDPGRQRYAYPAGPHFVEGTEPKGEFVLKVNQKTRYELRCKNQKPFWDPMNTFDMATGLVKNWGYEYRLGSINDIQPGDRLFITFRFPEKLTPDFKLSTLLQTRATEPWSKPEDIKRQHRPPPFDMGKYEGKELQVTGVANYVSMSCYGASMCHVPLYGRIVNNDNGIITVKIDRDEITEMWGYRFWKEEEAKQKGLSPSSVVYQGGWGSSDEAGRAALFSQIVKRWGDGTEQDRTYRFKVDDATDVYRNGLVAGSDELAVGDYVFVEYLRWWEDQQMFRETISPERVQASSQEIKQLDPSTYAYFVLLRDHYNREATWQQGDLNGDGVVDYADLKMLVPLLMNLTPEQRKEVDSFAAEHAVPLASNVETDAWASVPKSIPLPVTDEKGLPLICTIVEPPAHGTVRLSGLTAAYCAEYGYSGRDAFSWKANNGEADSSVRKVGITVTDPSAILPPGDATLDGKVTFEDFLVAQANFGEGTSWSQGHFSKVGVVDFHDLLVIRRALKDLTPVQEAEVASFMRAKQTPTVESLSVDVRTAGKPTNITLHATDDLHPSSVLIYRITRQPEHGIVTIVGDTLSYTAQANYIGLDDCFYQASNGTTDSNQAQLLFSVPAPPVIQPVTDAMLQAFLIGELRVRIDPMKAFEQDDLDRNVHPAPGKIWRQCQDPSGMFDLIKCVGGQENALVHACVYVNSTENRKVQLWVGSDDGIQVFVNGKVVHTNLVMRGCAADQDKIENVQLTKGWNTLRLGISQGVGGWGFCMRIRNEAGNGPATGLFYSTSLPE